MINFKAQPGPYKGPFRMSTVAVLAVLVTVFPAIAVIQSASVAIQFLDALEEFSDRLKTSVSRQRSMQISGRLVAGIGIHIDRFAVDDVRGHHAAADQQLHELVSNLAADPVAQVFDEALLVLADVASQIARRISMRMQHSRALDDQPAQFGFVPGHTRRGGTVTGRKTKRTRLVELSQRSLDIEPRGSRTRESALDQSFDPLLDTPLALSLCALNGLTALPVGLKSALIA